VTVGSEPHVVRQVPAWIPRIIVQHDVIRIPEPVAAVIRIIGRDREVEAANVKPVRTAAMESPHVTRTDGPRKMPVLPGAIEMIACVALFMTDPLIIFRVHVRRLGMAFLIAEAAPGLVRRGAAIAIWWSAAVCIAAIGLTAACWPMCRNVPVADALIGMLLATALRRCSAASLRPATFLSAARLSTCECGRGCIGGEGQSRSQGHCSRCSKNP